MSMIRRPDCGICGALKVERRGRLVCQPCASRHAREHNARKGPVPSTPERRAIKAQYRNKVRPSGLTNGQVNALKKRYGIGEATYLKIRQKSRDRCAICDGCIANECVIDHEHATGRIRGCLCRKCNMAIGLMREDPETLRRAAEYIERHCRDVKQLCDDLGNPKLPEQVSTEHHALADALWTREAWEFLQARKSS